MAILGGDFGVMVVVDGTDEEIASIERDLPALEKQTGLQFLVRRTRGAHKEGGLPCEIVATSLDQEGIVHSIAESLQRLGVNIVSLETSSYPATMTGAPLFRFEAIVDVPRGVGLANLREHMASVAKKFDLDVDVRNKG